MNRYEANNTRETRPDARRVTAQALHAFQLPAEMEETCRIAGLESTSVKRSQFKPSIFVPLTLRSGKHGVSSRLSSVFSNAAVLSGRLDFSWLLTPKCVAEWFSVSRGGFACRISRRLCQEDQLETKKTGGEAKNALMCQIFRQHTQKRLFIFGLLCIFIQMK